MTMQSVFVCLGQSLRRYDFVVQAAAIIISLLAAIILIRSLPTGVYLSWIQQKTEGLGNWAPVAFVIVFILLTAFFLPGWPLNVMAGVLFGSMLGGAITSFSSTAAAAVSFLLGRYVARDWVKRNVRRFPRLQAVYRELATAESWKVVAAVRLSHGLPFGMQNFLLGASPVGFVSYLLTTWLITLPGIFVIAYFGNLAGTVLAPGDDPIAGMWQWILRGGGIVIAGAAILYLGRFTLQAIKQPDMASDNTSFEIRGNTGWPWGTATALAASLTFLVISLSIYINLPR
jgi:uncharacterized membrane protein YdjX (TVP38/TMEM64 family)